MRQILDHIAAVGDRAPTVTALDEPGPGGANHLYAIDWGPNPTDRTVIDFQNGPILSAGANGVTNEALLAIVADRLKAFQAGDYRCKENALALEGIGQALAYLTRRTRERMARGVEGTSGL